MLETVSTGWFADLATNLLVSLIVFAVGFLIGKRRERALLAGRNLEQYDFYPFTIDKDGSSVGRSTCCAIRMPWRRRN
jgi:hypothetical protein